VVEATLARLSADSLRPQQMLRDQLATLTVGSGAAAMILAHTRLAPGGHRFHGGTSLAATEHNQLCRASSTWDHRHAQPVAARGGVAQRTWAQAQKELGWSAESVDLFALHQVSELHTQELARAVGFDLAKAFLIY